MNNTVEIKSAKEIADWFIGYGLAEADETGTEHRITSSTLQKLLYFAQGHHLREYRTPLFLDDIEAWEHGPVICSVYNEHKNDNSTSNHFVNLHNEFSWDLFPEELSWFLLKVWNTYGHLSEDVLQSIIRQDLPYSSARQESDYSKASIIDINLLTGYYLIKFVS